MQPSSAYFCIFSTCFKFIQQKVEKTKKSAEAGCLKFYVCSTVLFFYNVV